LVCLGSCPAWTQPVPRRPRISRCGPEYLGPGAEYLGPGAEYLGAGPDCLGAGPDCLGAGPRVLGCGPRLLGCGPRLLGCGAPSTWVRPPTAWAQAPNTWAGPSAGMPGSWFPRRRRCLRTTRWPYGAVLSGRRRYTGSSLYRVV